MKNVVTYVVIVFAMAFQGIGCTGTDELSFWQKVHRNVQQSDEARALQTRDESKLSFPLYDLLIMAERADTSAKDAAKLRVQLEHNKYIRTDSLGRVDIVIDITSIQHSDEVANLVRSHDGFVTFQGSVPAIGGYLPVKQLRVLTVVPFINRIYISQPGTTN